MEPSTDDLIRLSRKLSNIAPSAYDVTSRCNLSCTGCYYYEGIGDPRSAPQKSLTDFDNFFQSEKERGINYPHFAGGEPSLRLDVLEVAAKYWKQGAIYTNGLIKIPESLKFKILVSLWGNRETDAALRGRETWSSIEKNYKEDDRCSLLFTANKLNIDHAEEVVHFAKSLGLKCIFSLFSPTRSELARLDGERSKLELGPSDAAAIINHLRAIRDKYQENTIFPEEYAQLALDPVKTFNVDPETGWARACTLLNNKVYRHYNHDLNFKPDSCCTPDVDCANCRVYLNVHTKILSTSNNYFKNTEKRHAWHAAMKGYLEMHFFGNQLST